MKKLTIVFAIIVASFASALSADAQLRFGLKAGVAINSLHFNESAFDADNRAGFTGGAMIEFTAPVVGVGVDASLMYVRRNAQFMEQNEIHKDNRDYIDIPVNLKWKMNLPLVNKIVRPMLFTGPSLPAAEAPRKHGVTASSTLHGISEPVRNFSHICRSLQAIASA